MYSTIGKVTETALRAAAAESSSCPELKFGAEIDALRADGIGLIFRPSGVATAVRLMLLRRESRKLACSALSLPFIEACPSHTCVPLCSRPFSLVQEGRCAWHLQPYLKKFARHWFRGFQSIFDLTKQESANFASGSTVSLPTLPPDALPDTSQEPTPAALRARGNSERVLSPCRSAE